MLCWYFTDQLIKTLHQSYKTHQGFVTIKGQWNAASTCWLGEFISKVNWMKISQQIFNQTMFRTASVKSPHFYCHFLTSARLYHHLFLCPPFHTNIQAALFHWAYTHSHTEEHILDRLMSWRWTTTVPIRRWLLYNLSHSCLCLFHIKNNLLPSFWMLERRKKKGTNWNSIISCQKMCYF